MKREHFEAVATFAKTKIDEVLKQANGDDVEAVAIFGVMFETLLLNIDEPIARMFVQTLGHDLMHHHRYRDPNMVVTMTPSSGTMH